MDERTLYAAHGPGALTLDPDVLEELRRERDEVQVEIEETEYPPQPRRVEPPRRQKEQQ